MRYAFLMMSLMLGAGLLLGGCVFDSRGLPFQPDTMARTPDRSTNSVDFQTDTPADVGARTTGLKRLAAGEGRLWFGLSSGTQRLRLLSWREDHLSWFVESKLPALRGDLQWVTSLLLSDHRELAAVKTEDAAIEHLQLLTWDGADWREDMVITTQPEAHSKTRDFAMARESSGEVLLVFRDEQWLQYQTFSGGQWSATLPISINASDFPDEFLGDPLWVELIPRPEADEITLVFADTAAHLVTLVWDGNSFLADSTKLLEDDLKTNPENDRVSNRPFDASYQFNSGKLMVAWANDDEDGFYYQQRKVDGKWDKKKHIKVPAGRPDFIDLAGELDSDRIAAAFLDMGHGYERLALGVWDGHAWVGAKEYEPIRDVNDTATGDFSGAVAWLGTQSRAICVFADDSKSMLNWYSWEEGNAEGEWTRGQPVTVPGMGEMESVTLSTMGQRGKLMAIFSDEKSRLYHVQYAAEGWTTPVSFSEEISQIDTVPFSFAVMP